MNNVMFLFLILISTFSCSLNRSYQFAEIPWGSNGDEVSKGLAKAGFIDIKYIEHGNIVFQGELMGYKSFGLCAMSGKKGLVKTVITIITPDRESTATFDSIVTVLTKKYGAPRSKSILTAHFYKSDVAGDKDNLLVSITDQLNVELSYESKEFGEYLDKKKEGENNML